MGGWIVLSGPQDSFHLRAQRFKSLFSIKGVPPLNVETFEPGEDSRALLWAWNEKWIPDTHFRRNQSSLMLLSGVITSLGDLCPVLPNQEEAAGLILDLWTKHGDDVIEKINGSFSLLFQRLDQNEICLFVDRFASRSVWLTRERNVWIMGNYPSAIAALMNENPRFSPAGLWSYFHAGRQVGPQGLYSGLRALMAGQKAVLSGSGEIRVTNWRKRRYQPEGGISPREWGGRLAEAIGESAERYRGIAQSPYLFLSGGLDSRLAAAAYGSPLRTLSLCTRPNAETKIASRVSRILGLEHRIIIRSPYWYYDTDDASSLISSGLYLNQHAHFICPVKQILNQDSCGEFLLGDLLENFNKHYFRLEPDILQKFSPAAAEDVLYRLAPYRVRDPSRLGTYFNGEVRDKLKRLYKGALDEYASSLQDVSDDPADCLDTFLRWANVGVTPTYNMITCIRPLASERNICLDNGLNELSLTIPSSVRGKGILHKWTLYHLNKKLLLLPDANTFMPPFVPQRAKALAKKIRPWLGKMRRHNIGTPVQKPQLATSGSWLLMHEMYRKDQHYRKQIEDLIYDPCIYPEEIFDREAIRESWQEYLNGKIELHFEIVALKSFGSLNKLIPSGGIAF
jgi:hypothetical protein